MRTATAPNLSTPEYRRQTRLGPDLAEIKPQPETSSPENAVAKTSRPKPRPEARSPQTKLQAALTQAGGASGLEQKASGLEQKITAATKETAPAAEKLLKEAGKGGLPKMKLAPRTLIASLEKFVTLPPEQLIGEDIIDLEATELEPMAKQSVQLVNAVSADHQDAQGSPAAEIQGGDGAATAAKVRPDDPPDDKFSALVMADATATTKSQISPQPVGMSFFERFALSMIVASRNHVASIADNSTPASTANPQEAEIQPAVLIDEPDVVELVENAIPPSSVSPGLDEMVISSTSQTDFDLNDSEMVFSGNVQVQSPRFNLRADKFIVHLKKDGSGMSFGEAVGNVVIDLRENGRPTGYSGLASNAIYHPLEGKITLSGWPKIRQQYKEHVAITPETKMILYTDGRVKTLGRNRTVIRK